MTTDDDTTRAAVQQLLSDYLSLYSEQRWDEWIELWTDDGVLEFPFAPAGRRSRYTGKPEILAYMRPLGGRIKADQIERFEVHAMVDPTTVCFEMAFTGHLAATGAAYDQTYISIIRTRDGKISHYREYWNPLVSIDAAGGREAWTASFGIAEATS